jgi:hypothetical protein
VTDEAMIIDVIVIVETETRIGETVVMTTTGTTVATETAIEMTLDVSAPDRVAIAGGTMIVVNTFETPARIGGSGDSSGVEGGKRG